jgi:hypothetical protein
VLVGTGAHLYLLRLLLAAQVKGGNLQ